MKHSNRKFIVILMVVGVCSTGTTFAQNSGLGLGTIFGGNTGISLKNWGGGTTAVVGGIVWAFGDRDALHLHLDYLLHDFGLLQVASGRLPIYYGIGARAKFGEGKGKNGYNYEVGVRIPLRIDYLFA